MSTVRIVRPDDAPGVAELVLDRVDALNALSTDHARAIADATTTVAADRDVRAVVLVSAASRAFCVGADLKERDAFDDDDLRRQREVFRAAFAGVRELAVPTVAAVHGYALGGGLELALSCDVIVADETAVVGLPEVSVGLVPGGGGTQLLARRAGWGRAADLLFTARRVEAAEAYRLGIVDRLVSAGQARTVAIELAATVAANSPVAIANVKSAMRRGIDVPLQSALEIEDAAWHAVAFSADRKEGIRAFNEKRTPVWPGRRE